ncbi:MAG: acyl-CoA dehydrogenase, partial [Acidimicrobiia bacterium]|nr:acyl-CoA dehydrogenase [Acidimicrobiia bacterium]
MDFALASADDPRRLRVRDWLSRHPDPTSEQLARAGYVKPRFPAPYGQGADVLEELIITEELASAGVSLPDNAIALGWAAPTLLHFGNAAQQKRHLWPILTGEEQWCQLFSEPNSGSDLASLQTRAERDGEEWVINGQKIWTSGAEVSRYGMLLARTDPDAPKHRGITWFICPMRRPGIETRPIIEMTGNRHFNEVFLTDVRIPAENVVGELHAGWRAARYT